MLLLYCEGVHRRYGDSTTISSRCVHMYLLTHIRTYVCTYAGQFQEWHSRDRVLAETGIRLFQYVKTVKGMCVRAYVGR